MATLPSPYIYFRVFLFDFSKQFPFLEDSWLIISLIDNTHFRDFHQFLTTL